MLFLNRKGPFEECLLSKGLKVRECAMKTLRELYPRKRKSKHKGFDIGMYLVCPRNRKTSKEPGVENGKGSR